MADDKNSIVIEDKTFNLLLKKEEIQSRIKYLGTKITNDFKNSEVILICVLKGGFFFFADVVKYINIKNLVIDFIEISSYKGNISFTEIELKKDISIDIKGKNIILFDDIADSGNSADYLIKHLFLKNPNSIKICTLINKLENRSNKIKIDYVGFNIKSGFLIGCGMDYKEIGRNLSDIYELNN
ncbi:MAG: hypoxanthine phosphoribosyltransferase [Candidatus Dadabacteria bacterium]|nr:hypoxanthine phosphoribosyltransferase [Candidatus Dadabacteria bacterium]